MRACRNRVLAIGLCMLSTAAAAPVMSADGIDPEADRILKSMSSYLATTKAFSLNAEVALEVVTKNGQKLQLMSSETVVLQRPSRFRIHVKGMVADAEFVFDGRTLTLYGRRPNVYVQKMSRESSTTPSAPSSSRPDCRHRAPTCCTPIRMPFFPKAW